MDGNAVIVLVKVTADGLSEVLLVKVTIIAGSYQAGEAFSLANQDKV